MQIKLFTIPIQGGEGANEEMNKFMNGKKVLHVESELIDSGKGIFWCFCIRYLDHRQEESRKRTKVDYKELLDGESFQRFAKYREIRKRIATEASIPAYTIFTNEELAELARIEQLTPARMKSIKGIGEKKAEKYAPFFIEPTPSHEKKELPD